MKIQLASIAVLGGLLLAMPCSPAAQQSKDQQPGLKEHYDAAQRFHQQGKMEHAAAEYRAFIAEATGELGTGYSQAGMYDDAAQMFDESLRWNPDQPALRMEYARAALAHGDFDHAKLLAEEMLKRDAKSNSDPKDLAKAHLVLGRALLKMNQDKQARKELETAVDLDPDFEDGYALAVVCLDMDDGKCAGRIFSEMEASFGNTAILHMELGRAYIESDFPQKAIPEFKKAIAKNPHLPEAHYSLAAAYLASAETSSLENAEKELKAELQVSPKDFLTYSALGHIAVIQHKYADAAAYLKRAIALNPGNPDAYLYLGQMYYEMHRSADAESALRSAIQHTTDVSRNRYQIQKAHYLLGRLLIKSGHEAEAEAEMRSAQKLMALTLAQDKSRFSGRAPGGNGMGGVEISSEERPIKLAAAKDAREIEDFRKQIAAPVADSYNNLGVIAAGRKDYVMALRCFKGAGEWNPSLPGLDYNLGRAAFMSSHFQDAVPPLTRYLDAHPSDTSIRSVLGISLFMTKNYPAVVKTLEPLKTQIDAVPQVEYVYAASLVKTRQRAAGMEMLESMEKKNPSVPDVHRSLAEAYADQGKPDLVKARQEFAAAIRLNPNDAQAHAELGALDLRTGDTNAAISELETAVRLEPSDSAAHAELAAAYKRASRPADAQRELELSHAPQPK